MSCGHEFALYYEHARARVGAELLVSDVDLVHRITRVLRLRVGDCCVLFNCQYQSVVQIELCTKKACSCTVLSCCEVKPLEPRVTWLLPILQREQLEHAFSLLSALGAEKIVPLITEKSRNKWGQPKDYERMQRIMIAAAEQSKQFHLPSIEPVQKLIDCFEGLSADYKIFFDPEGHDYFGFIEAMRSSKAQANITCLVGPEGDLSSAEKLLVAQRGFASYRLTPTVLKASHAVTVAMGALRTLC